MMGTTNGDVQKTFLITLCFLNILGRTSQTTHYYLHPVTKFFSFFFFFQRDELHEAAVRFSRRYGMDQCVGCLDGTYVPISRPVNNEGAYVTRHGYHALNVLVGYNFYTNCNLYNRLHLSPVKKQKTLI